MSWGEAIASVALWLTITAIVAGVGAMIGWTVGRADIGAAVGAFVGMGGWIVVGAFLPREEP